MPERETTKRKAKVLLLSVKVDGRPLRKSESEDNKSKTIEKEFETK